MKRRDGDSRNGGDGSGGNADFAKKKRRLGGKGLSLEVFGGANKSKPVVTASQIRKQREVYQNAKKVQKYRKTLKHLSEEGHQFKPHVPLSFPAHDNAEKSGERLPQSVNEAEEQPSSSTGEKTHALRLGQGNGKKDTQIGSHGKKSLRKPKGPTQVERLREEYEKKRQEEEAVRKERQEAYAKQQAAREKSQQERKDVQNKLRKKTKKGQPVMKHRMEHLLDTLQRQLQE